VRILTVCGMGSGSSLILKMNVDEILAKHNIEASVEACDLGSVSGQDADLIVSTAELKSKLDGLSVKKVFVDNVVDKDAIEEALIKSIN